jgi:glutamyl-tRNA(Gln) amidotransferase subunit D
MKANFGDQVEINKINGDKFSGTFVSDLDKVIQIKLKSGYNMGFSKDEIKKITVKKTFKPIAEKKPKVKQSNNKKKVLILHTGGTIASKVDYKTGGVFPLFKPEELLTMFPELNEIVSIDTKLLFNVWSEDFEFKHFNQIAKEIEKNHKKYDGIIITHGTDTIHYTSAALSFILENIKIPIIIVGSQRSSDRGSSDSALNVINAAYYICKSKFNGVGVCMHENSEDDNCFILAGTNIKKMHTTRRDTFRPINRHPLARVNFKSKKIENLSKLNSSTGDFTVKLFNDKLKVGILKSRPGLTIEEIKVFENFDGLIVEGTGLGHVILLNEKISQQFKKISKKIPTIITSQCVYGRLNLNVYSRGREMQKMGFIGNFSATSFETSYIKLCWLLSNFSKDKIKDLYDKDFRGEIIPRIEENTFLY